jgi:hypothetical protein
MDISLNGLMNDAYCLSGCKCCSVDGCHKNIGCSPSPHATPVSLIVPTTSAIVLFQWIFCKQMAHLHIGLILH